jgi:hypothetical protein
VGYQALLYFSFKITSQVLTIDNSDPAPDDVVTITFDAKSGNAELAGYTGDIYAYTGVITTESANDMDWKHVRNNWGVVNPATLMTPVGNDVYTISFNINQFYELGVDEVVLKLAFLFHNADYSIIGRSAENQDLFINLREKKYWGISKPFTGRK